jgi:hypothetical protein
MSALPAVPKPRPLSPDADLSAFAGLPPSPAAVYIGRAGVPDERVEVVGVAGGLQTAAAAVATVLVAT